jgi:predicted ArsR family transcriptional regulator
MNLPALFGYSRLLALSSDDTFNVTDIASISGYTDRQVRRHVIELVEYGMLAVVVDSDGR